MKQDNLTRLHTQEIQDEETRQRNMRRTPEKILEELCSEHGRIVEDGE